MGYTGVTAATTAFQRLNAQSSNLYNYVSDCICHHAFSLRRCTYPIINTNVQSWVSEINGHNQFVVSMICYVAVRIQAYDVDATRNLYEQGHW